MRMATALATVMLAFGLGATAQAGTTTNLIAANLIAANLIAANKLAANRIVPNRLASNGVMLNRLAANRIVVNGVSPAVPVGEGAVADIVAIELPDGTSFAR